MRPKQLHTFLSKTLEANIPTLILGQPGIGKTDITHDVCNDLGYELLVNHPVVEDPTNYKGMPVAFPEQKSAEFIPFGNLRKLMEASEPTVCFMDDFGQAAPSVQAPAMQLFQAREIDGKKISDEVRFVVATNDKDHKAGVTGILEPVKSRLAIVKLETHIEDWTAWAWKNNVNPIVISLVNFRPNLLTDWKPTGKIENGSSPRTVTRASALLDLNLPSDIEFEAYAGAAGEGFAAELVGFLKVYRELPDPQEALQKPDSIRIPTDPSAVAALTGACAEKVTVKTMANFSKLLKKMPQEFSVLGMRLCTMRDMGLMETEAFQSWWIDNSDVLTG